ncbi:hypothetical protein GCM10027615_71930 [Plantactinospora veratri]
MSGSEPVELPPPVRPPGPVGQLAPASAGAPFVRPARQDAQQTLPADTGRTPDPTLTLDSDLTPCPT